MPDMSSTDLLARVARGEDSATQFKVDVRNGDSLALSWPRSQTPKVAPSLSAWRMMARCPVYRVRMSRASTR